MSVAIDYQPQVEKNVHRYGGVYFRIRYKNASFTAVNGSQRIRKITVIIRYYMSSITVSKIPVPYSIANGTEYCRKRQSLTHRIASYQQQS